MTTNNDLFVRPPAEHPIPNDGVSQVGMPDQDDTRQWDVLEYELSNFVCEGEYADGLERILGSYLTNQSRSTQPAVWVSGFYGSGKSHLVRVLEHLWADTELPGGASARGLVRLPQEITDHLRELTALGRRVGAAPWSVAGSLDRGSAGSLNTAFLAVVLDAAGLPTRVAPAQVALWLVDEGIYDDVARSVADAGKELRRELSTYNLSRPLSEAILAALPGFAPDAAAVRGQLKNQFPDVQTVSIGETLSLLDRVLRFVGGSGQVPPTLVVLDEVQQYIGDDVGRAMDVQKLVEAVTKETDNRVLLVATGQQEMTADPTLQKIRDRFTGKVVLKNQDVDAVVRKVLLAKDPARKPELAQVLEGASAEVSREIAGTQIAHTTADDEMLAADYPLLPSRRRFWEHVLRAADAGRAGQLRSQLRIVHDAAAEISAKPVGTVIGADYLYEAKNEDLNQTAQLSKGLQRLIAEQRAQDETRGRILGLIHLISLLPTSGTGDTGVRATAAHLADLLVEDLAHDGARLRADVPRLLREMADEGVLQEDGGEYRLQTDAGRVWEDAFRNQRANVTSQEIVAKRDALLRGRLEEHLPRRIRQGTAKVPRDVRPHWGDDEPPASDEIAVWVRSEWDGVTPRQFESSARELGSDSPVVLLHLPRLLADDLTQELRNAVAAEHVLNQRGRPQDEEGQHAFASMSSRRQRAEERVAQIVDETVTKATVLNGGGSSPSGIALEEKVVAAAENAADRRFPRFREGDDNRWTKVQDKLKQGAGVDALAAVGHTGDPTQQRVVKEVLGRVTGAGTKAADIVSALTSAPYGWPEDAVKGAFGVLVAGGHVHATVNGSEADVRQVLATTRWGNVYLRSESVVLSAAQRIQARQAVTSLLAGATGDAVVDDNLVAKAGEAMDRLTQRAAALSGAAPLPAVTLPPAVGTVRGASGNDRVVALLAARSELADAADALSAMEARRGARERALADARALAAAATTLEAARPARDRLSAFEESRELLAADDGLSPIVADLTSVLRDAVNDASRRLAESLGDGRARLESADAWGELDDAQRADLLASAGLDADPDPDLRDTSAVLAAVSRRPLPAWGDAVDAVGARVTKALDEAVRRTTPQAVSVALPGRTLRSPDDVEAYVAELRSLLTSALDGAGTVVVRGA